MGSGQPRGLGGGGRVAAGSASPGVPEGGAVASRPPGFLGSRSLPGSAGRPASLSVCYEHHGPGRALCEVGGQASRRKERPGVGSSRGPASGRAAQTAAAPSRVTDRGEGGGGTQPRACGAAGRRPAGSQRHGHLTSLQGQPGLRNHPWPGGRTQRTPRPHQTGQRGTCPGRRRGAGQGLRALP